MKTALPVLCTLLLGACTSAASVGYSPYPEPIPGSITYGGQPRTKLTKSPIGSTFSHQFRDRFGRQVYETYVIAPDRSLLLVRRRYRDLLFDFDDD